MAHYAASEGDVEGLERALADGADPNETDYNTYTPAHWACMQGSDQSLPVLAKYKTDFEIKNDNGNTPLLLASEKGHIKCVRFLVEEAKVNVEARNKWQATALQMACVFGNFDIVKYLHEHGARLDVRNMYGASPLHFCFAGGQIEILRWMVRQQLGAGFRDASPDALSHFFAHRFVRAAQHKNPQLAFANIRLLPTEKFLDIGEFPVFDKCVEMGIHVNGDVLTDTTKVLFVSHRWETPHHPDPERHQYRLVAEYLAAAAAEGRRYDFVWLDYACICQDKASEDFALHLSNIPTALFCASDCLVVPKSEQIDMPSVMVQFGTPSSSLKQIDEMEDGVHISNLKDYLDRGWCQLEAIVAMFTGCDAYVCYKAAGADGAAAFPKLVPYRGTHAAGFHLATSEQLSDLGRGGAYLRARGLWSDVSEPTESLKTFTDVVIVCHHQFQELFERIISMAVDQDDITMMGQSDNDFMGRKFLDAYQGIGNFTNEEDRLVVVRLLLFSIAYAMYDLEGEGHFGEAARAAAAGRLKERQQSMKMGAAKKIAPEEMPKEVEQKAENKNQTRGGAEEGGGNNANSETIATTSEVPVVTQNQKGGCNCVVM